MLNQPSPLEARPPCQPMTPPTPRPLHPRSASVLQLIGPMVRTSRAVHPRNSLHGLIQAAALFYRQFTQREVLRDWYLPGRAPSLMPLRDMLACRPDLVAVLRRPYINTFWEAKGRLLAIEEHYRQVAGPARALRLAVGGTVTLATVAIPQHTLEIVLDSPEWFIHEGELALNLFLDGERIYTVAFSLGLDAGEPVALIGALQGLGSERALDVYRGLTHALHGLRPRDLLIAAFRTLCRELGLTRYLAVGDTARVAISPYFGASKRVQSSYDAVWQEHGGVHRPDDFHVLPIQVARRTHAEIPARKRSAYRQRYAMLDRLEADIGRSLAARS